MERGREREKMPMKERARESRTSWKADRWKSWMEIDRCRNKGLRKGNEPKKEQEREREKVKQRKKQTCK